MTPEQESQCHTIIHSSAMAAAAGNLIPVPGLGIAADITAMTAMAISLAGVLGHNIPAAVAEAMAIAAIRDTVLKQPVNFLAKEISKFVPFIGSLVAPAISFGMVEAAGWSLVAMFEHEKI